MGIWGLVGGGGGEGGFFYRGDYEAGKNNGVVLCYLWQLLKVVTAEGIDTYLTYSTLPPNPFIPLHLTHTMRSQAHITRRYTTILSDSAINVSNRS